MDKIKEHYSRIFHWNVNETVVISEEERSAIDEYLQSQNEYKLCGEGDDMLQRVIVWRTTLLKTIIPLSITAAVLSVIEVVATFDYYSEFEETYYMVQNILTNVGYASFLSNGSISGIMMALTLFLSLCYRFDVHKSARILRWGFIALLVVKIWPAVIQNDAKFNFEEDFSEDHASIILLLRFQGALKHSFELLPLIIAFPRGAIAGSMSMLGLQSKAVTPRVLVMYFYPFATFLLVMGSSTIAQLAGDWILATSLSFFFLSDLFMYASYRHVIEGDTNELDTGRKAKAMRYSGTIGVILLVVWFAVKVIPCNSSDNMEELHCLVFKSLSITPLKIIKTLVFFLRNTLFSKVLFSDLILSSMSSCEPKFLLWTYGTEDENDSDEET